MRKFHRSLIVVAALLFAVCAVLLLMLWKTSKEAKIPPSQTKLMPAQAKYAKGSVAFFYPAVWEANDIPVSDGNISVQVVDTNDNIVFVASSNIKKSDPRVNGKLVYEKDILFDGVTGKERLWENAKTQTFIFRADQLEFEKRFYRFEMFANASRKVKAEKAWGDIVATIKFARTGKEEIKAVPK